MITRVIIKGYRIFGELDLAPQSGMNIIVGDNESGKSSLLEAMILGLTGRINGRWARDELNPYWFYQPAIAAFFQSCKSGQRLDLPRIEIELYFDNQDDQIQHLRGIHNSARIDTPGVLMRIAPSRDFAEDLEAYLSDENCPPILPTEYYDIEWRDFADTPLQRRPRGLGVAAIDSRTIRSSSGVDYHTREMLSDFVSVAERAAIAVAHRSARHTITVDNLEPVNARIATASQHLHDAIIGLQMDQSSSASWESSLVPQVADIPFAMSGQGQQAAIKVALALSRSGETTSFAFVEEPENHLSHTNLTKLVARIAQLAQGRQTFVTTHSSYVLNRLGLDTLILLHNGAHTRFSELPEDTVKYFKKISGYDTLRLVLASTVVLVEGPSDEILLQRAYRDHHDGRDPSADGIDIVSMHGLAIRRCLEVCAALGRRVAILRDNDGKPAQHWTDPLGDLLQVGERELFIGDPSQGHTLEPQMLDCNTKSVLRSVLGLKEDVDVVDWMSKNKTESALRIAENETPVTYPDYFTRALAFIA